MKWHENSTTKATKTFSDCQTILFFSSELLFSDGVLDLSTKKNHSAGTHKASSGFSSAAGVKG